MVEHIFVLETSIDHVTVVTKEVKKCMNSLVYNLDVDIVPEYFLLNTGLKQFPGHTVIADLSGLGKMFKDFLMVFLEIVEKCRARSLHLTNCHLDDPEECLNGIIRLFNQPMSLLRGLLLIVLYDLQQQSIFVLEALIDGALGNPHLFSKRIHGHAFDAILSKQPATLNQYSISDFQSV